MEINDYGNHWLSIVITGYMMVDNGFNLLVINDYGNHFDNFMLAP